MSINKRKKFTDIVNQQKKEISELLAEADNYKKIVEKQQSISMERYFEIKRLKEKVENLEDYNENLLAANTALSNEILEAKHKAYKEFAEKLKIYSCSLKDGHDMVDTICIDNLLKEMVGEE